MTCLFPKRQTYNFKPQSDWSSHWVQCFSAKRFPAAAYMLHLLKKMKSKILNFLADSSWLGALAAKASRQWCTCTQYYSVLHSLDTFKKCSVRKPLDFNLIIFFYTLQLGVYKFPFHLKWEAYLEHQRLRLSAVSGKAHRKWKGRPSLLVWGVTLDTRRCAIMSCETLTQVLPKPGRRCCQLGDFPDPPLAS